MSKHHTERVAREHVIHTPQDEEKEDEVHFTSTDIHDEEDASIEMQLQEDKTEQESDEEEGLNTPPEYNTPHSHPKGTCCRALAITCASMVLVCLFLLLLIAVVHGRTRIVQTLESDSFSSSSSSSSCTGVNR
jgi:hypothetical protein